MNEVTKLYNQMLVNLEKGINDLDKFNDGNKAAGTRVRKNMQGIKNLAQQVRLEVQEMKNAVAAQS